MKRVILEFPYQDMWHRLFGPNFGKVEVIEVIRSLKCDFEGVGMICRIRFKDKRIGVRDLIGKGAIRSIEILYKERNGSMVVFIQGGPVVSAPRAVLRSHPSKLGILSTGPAEFLDKDRMRIEFLCKDKETKKVLDFYQRAKLPHRIVEVSRPETLSDSHLSKLTLKQRQVVLTAFSLGYYDIPRRVTTEELAKHLKLSTSTLAEHIRKAERTLLSRVVGS